MGHWLWYFLSSTHGKSQIAKRQTVNATVTSLSAANLREIKIPHPSPRELNHIARLVEASETAYETAVEAARLRRSVLRDAIISQIGRNESLEQWSQTMTLTRQELESKLWQAADILRGQIDAADYKNYIFSILFLKRLSDRFEEEVEQSIASNVPKQIALTDIDEHEFFVPESARWSALTGTGMNLGEALNIAGYAIEEANPRLDGVLTGANWNDENKLGSPANRESIIRSLLNHFNALDLRDENLQEEGTGPGNVLGDAYEYLINQFADDAGKKGGEFYTPRSVVRLIVELLKPEERMRICDPTLGSGGMLIYTAQYVREQGGNYRNLALHGQERNLGTLGHRQAEPAAARPSGGPTRAR